MLVKDIMSEDVHTISPDFSVKKAAEAMTKRKVGSLIVVSGKKLEGIVTERDILKKAVCLGKDVNKTKVKDVIHPEELYAQIKKFLRQDQIVSLEELGRFFNLERDEALGLSRQQYKYIGARPEEYPPSSNCVQDQQGCRTTG